MADEGTRCDAVEAGGIPWICSASSCPRRVKLTTQPGLCQVGWRQFLDVGQCREVQQILFTWQKRYHECEVESACLLAPPHPSSCTGSVIHLVAPIAVHPRSFLVLGADVLDGCEVGKALVAPSIAPGPKQGPASRRERKVQSTGRHVEVTMHPCMCY